jgi:cytochrome c-type biogenesis protein CcmE
MSDIAKNDVARSRRVFLAGALLVAGSALAFVAFGNIGENLVYYWDPTQLVAAGDKSIGATIRLGGVVKDGTMNWNPDDSELEFTVSDGTEEVPVHCSGAPPQMFREGIGVVVEGTMTHAGIFESSRLMVKHSNEYKAPQEGETVEELYKTVESL